MTRADLVVLGAGPAGVGAAYRAAAAGRRVVVVERAPGPGGMAGSFEVAGLRVDFGSHRLHPSIDPAILAMLHGLLGDDLQLRRRNGRIRLAGRWIGFPLRPLDLVRRLPPSFAVRTLRDAALAPARRPRADTFAEVLRAGVGPTLAERFYFPYARKLWGLAPEEIAGEQARRRVAAASARKLLARALGTGRAVFWYPRRGYGQLWEALAEAASDAGAEFRYGAAAERVGLDGEGVRVELAGGGAIEGERLWSTLPLTALSRMAGGPEAALAFRSMVLVYLVVPTPRYSAFDAHYLPEAWTPVTRVSEPKNYRDGDDPAERTVLCAELPCAEGDAVWQAGEDELAELVGGTLAGTGLPRPATIETHVRRLRQVYPVYRVGYERELARVDRWAEEQPRLLTFGRLGSFVHDNAHHALAMAWAAADALRPDGGFDRELWSSARDGFARHVVED